MALSLSASRLGSVQRQSRPRTAVVVRVFEAPTNGATNTFPEGAKVKVVKPVKVFHVPKHPEVELEGMQGEVQKNCAQFKGKVLSANLPIVVKFDKPVKFLAHLGEDELELVQ